MEKDEVSSSRNPFARRDRASRSKPSTRVPAAISLSLALVLVVLAGLAVYAGGLRGEFLGADHALFNRSPLLFVPAPVSGAAVPGSLPRWLPTATTTLSLAADRLLWGPLPAGFRSTNLILHLTATLLLLAVCLRRTPGARRGGRDRRRPRRDPRHDLRSRISTSSHAGQEIRRDALRWRELPRADRTSPVRVRSALLSDRDVRQRDSPDLPSRRLPRGHLPLPPDESGGPPSRRGMGPVRRRIAPLSRRLAGARTARGAAEPLARRARGSPVPEAPGP